MGLLSLYSWSLPSRTFFRVGVSWTEVYALLLPCPQKVVNITGGANMSAWWVGGWRREKEESPKSTMTAEAKSAFPS